MLLDKTFDPRIKGKLSPAFLGWFAGARRSAMKYSFSPEVVTEIAGLIRDEPSLVTHNLQFALPPFDETYIELNYMSLVKQIRPDHAWAYDDEQDDDQLAFYVKDNAITMFVSRRDDPIMQIAPMAYVLPNGTAPPATFALPIERETKLAHLLGTTYNDERANMTPAIADWLCTVQHRVESEFFRGLNKHNAQNYLQCSMGEFRVACACLLWLAQPTHYHLADVPGSRKVFRGNVKCYSAHHVVKLRHDAVKSFKQAKAGLSDRAGPRRHQVRPYWRTSRATKGCVHDWSVFPDEEGRFYCGRCDARRKRVENYWRGDAGRGFVTKEYKA